MLGTNYHTHNRWCDGEGEIEEVVRAALDAGLRQVGISSHAPVPFPTTYALPLESLSAYRAEVLQVRERYRDRIAVWLGLELDALPELAGYNRQLSAERRAMSDEWPRPNSSLSTHRSALHGGFDYCLGSVHFLGRDDQGMPWPLDESDGRFAALLAARYGGDIRALVEDYYRLIAGLATYPGVDIVGHLDRGAVLWNEGGRYFSEDAPWYRATVERALQALAAASKVVELSTAGWRKGLGAPFPAPWILRRCRDLGIRVTPCTDAHHPKQIAYCYDDALALLRETGYREIAVLDPASGQWVMEALPEVARGGAHS